MIDIPGYKSLHIEHIVCDYNGTIAKDGLLLPGIESLFKELSHSYTIHVITADTFGSVARQLEKCDVAVKILTSSNHTEEKHAYVESLDSKTCAAIGNGNNDETMIGGAELGIAILGDEGCAATTLKAADIVCKSATDALELFLHPKRLVATLRR
ncbi:HAD family hydrolase [Hydrogenimonas sp.]